MRTLIITAVAIAAPASAFAGGYLVPNMAPRDLALGGATVADAEGAGAVSTNTAALAGQEGLDVAVSGGIINNSTEWKNGDLNDSQSKVGTPPTVAASYGMKLANDQAIGFGVGFGVVGGGSIEWPAGWPGQETFQSVNQQIFGIGGGVAFQALPYLKFGASYLRLQAAEEIHQKLNYLDGHVGDAGIALAGGANSFGLAAEVKVPSQPLKFGVTYSHAADIAMSGHVHFEEAPPSFQGLLHDQRVTNKILVPDVVFLGAAYDVMPDLTVMASGSWENWSDYHADEFVGLDKIMNPDGTTTTPFAPSIPRNYNDAWVARIAAEWRRVPQVPDLTVRAAILRSISDQPRDTLSPSLTDASSWALSVGGGYEVRRNLTVEAGLQLALFDEVTAEQTSPDTFQGSYNTHVILASVGVNWRTDLGMTRK